MTKRGIAAVRSADLAHQMDSGKFGLSLPREIALDPGAQRLARHVDMQQPHHRDRHAGADAIPMGFGAVVRGGEAGFFLDLAGDAAFDVEPVAADVIAIGRARGEIDATGVRGMLAHLAEHKRAVAAAQRAHAEAVEHAAVRKAPVPPGQEAREIGLEIIGAETPGGEHRIAAEQNTAVPELRPLALLGGEMRVDLGAPSVRERPRLRTHLEIERRDAMNDRRGH